MSLDEQIGQYSQNIQTQSYSMSVSEMSTMYKDKELGLNPQFQRFFRWSTEQKSRLIESLLLGIPIPPVFVTERDDSKWDVIDGLQRLSTILELMGVLLDKNGDLLPPLQLTRTHYLPDLENCYWSDEQGEFHLTESARIKIKRARIDVNIVQSSSDEDVKYEVFQRLNSGGSDATPQEIRNCLLIMKNSEFFNWMENLSSHPTFRECLPLTDRSIEEAFDMELVSRYVAFTDAEINELRRLDELSSYLNKSVISHAENTEYDSTIKEQNFKLIFDYLALNLGMDSFRRYDLSRQRYVGPMLVSLFEIVACGLAYHLTNGGELPPADEFLERHKMVWNEVGALPFVGSGIRASTRIPETVDFGRKWATA